MITPEEWEKYKNKVDSHDEFLDFFDEEGVEGRTVLEDLRLWRLVINRFSSLKFFIGIVVGILTVGIPAVWGAVKVIAFIKSYFN